MAARHLVPDLGRLYRLPLSQFVEARNALAAELRAAGRKVEAEEVRAAPKASPSAWAVSRLFAEEPEAMRALARDGERARSLGDPARVRAALTEALRRVEELRERAAGILLAAGQPASDAHLGRVADNLRALAFDPAAGESEARGWLARDLEPPGFDVLAGLQLAAQPAQAVEPAAKPAGRTVRRPAARGVTRPAQTAAAGRASQEDAAEVARRRAAVAAAERELEQAASRADFQRRRAERAAGEAQAAKRRVEEVRRLAEEAEAAARSAAEAAAEAEAARERARAALASARGRD
jgi:hypothetical protein